VTDINSGPSIYLITSIEVSLENMSDRDFRLLAVSPIDGRYGAKTEPLSDYFSEFGLIRNRLYVEVEWLKKIASVREFGVPSISTSCMEFLDRLVLEFNLESATRVKEFESVTNHDVKAVEYYIKEKMATHPEACQIQEFVHFTCTSEDINNLAYGLMIRDSLAKVLLPAISDVLHQLSSLSHSKAYTPLLALTHGQAATPTTFGREMAVYVHRLKQQLDRLSSIQIMGKFNGATGSFNAHIVAYPHVDWESISRDFVTNSLGLTYQPMSTQIECHDYISEISDTIARMSNISIGLSRDMWSYISRGVLKLRTKAGEVGSSTMPHKVNPIDFENAEGNLGMCVSLCNFFNDKLVISRLQRDLSDSTVLRNIGVGLGHFLIAFDSLKKGLSKIDVDEIFCKNELNKNWSLLAEPVQTIMRKAGIEQPYEKLKSFTRGMEINETQMKEFILSLEPQMNPEDFSLISNLTPETYIGIAPELAKQYGDISH
jgi:adenylosuccinate lyase